jgi:hypothetical protein
VPQGSIGLKDVLAKLINGLVDDEKRDIAGLLSDANVVSDKSDEESDNSDDSESFATELESDEEDDNDLLDQVQDANSSSSSEVQLNVSKRAVKSEQKYHAGSLPLEEDNQSVLLNMMNSENEESDDSSLADQEDLFDGHRNLSYSSQVVDDEDSQNSSPSTVENEESRNILSSWEAVLNQMQVLEKKKEESFTSDEFEMAFFEAEGRQNHRIVDLGVLIRSRGGSLH